VVEPALLRVLRNFGLVFTPVGPLVDHHGRRQPAAANLNELLATCRRLRPDVWSVITDDGKLLNNGNSDLKASA
jgi:N-acyl amino acid synthase of PEP-CTERM/exosortase system